MCYRLLNLRQGELLSCWGEFGLISQTVSPLTCVPQKAMVEVYKVIVHAYVKHLVKVRPKKLAKMWGPDIGQTVREDAQVLHSIISELVRASAVSLKRPHSTAL